MPCIDQWPDVNIRDERVTLEPFRKLCAVLVGRRSAPGARYEHIPSAPATAAAAEPRCFDRVSDKRIPKPIDPSFVQVVRELKARFEPELAKFPESQFLPEALLH
jgi:hypothetical protein